MGISYSFIDNKVYGPDDINDITKSLTGAGVAPFVSKESYNVSDLNGMTSALVDAGTCLDGCRCILENTGTTEMHVEVAQGIVFFESGVRLTVDEEGYIISITPNTAGYIYAHYSPSLQKADIVFGIELPTDGESVMLAKISESGDITDRRTFARSKVATLGQNATYSISDDRITVYDSYDVAPSYSDTEKIVGEIDLSGIDITKFNYLIYRYPYGGAGSTAPTYQEKYFDFKSIQRASFYIKGSLYYHSAMFDIIWEETRFIIVTKKEERVFGSYRGAFQSAIPYFKLV